MSALPSVAVIGAWLSSLLDMRRSDLEHRCAASNLVLAYARAYARAEGLDEAHAVVVAFSALRGPDGAHESTAVATLESAGVAVWPALRLVEDREREASDELERDALVPWGDAVSAHTPGPWEAHSFVESMEHTISAPGWDGFAVVYGNEDDNLNKQGGANARLIAESPALLALLKECLANSPGRTSDWRARVKDSIARAEGES